MKVYLTKMILNPLSNQVRSEVGNPRELHKTISRAFPKIENPPDTPKHKQKTPRNEYNILHRLDIDRHRGKAFLLVQSQHKPDWSFLDMDYADELDSKEVGENYRAIEKGMSLIFRLQANPTKRVGNGYKYPDEEKRGEFDEKFKHPKKRRRVPIYKEEDQAEWLIRQGERLGFEIANLKIDPPVRNIVSVEQGRIEFKKYVKGKNSKEKQTITYGSVVFEGVLKVTAADKFLKTLINGIGQGKAYGFGLLSVAKAEQASHG